MAVFHMPMVLEIEADSLEDAQRAMDEWVGDIDINDDLPAGTEDIDVSPTCEYNDEGQRLLYLPTVDESEEDGLDDDDDSDDFNDGEEDFS
jgi:hypothetical protein